MKIIINVEDEYLDHLLKRIVVVRQIIEDTKTNNKIFGGKQVGFASKEIQALCKETKSGFSIKYWKKD